MTEEELKKEAEEKAGIYFDSLDYDHGDVSDTPFSAYDVFVAYKKGALDFAEPREKRIAELEAQIEKMKCCENCKYYNNHYNEVVCKQQVINCKRILRQATRDQWEIKEK